MENSSFKFFTSIKLIEIKMTMLYKCEYKMHNIIFDINAIEYFKHNFPLLKLEEICETS